MKRLVAALIGCVRPVGGNDRLVWQAQARTTNDRDLSGRQVEVRTDKPVDAGRPARWRTIANSST